MQQNGRSQREQLDAEKKVAQVCEEAIRQIKAIDPATENWKSGQALPRARIKKIMKEAMKAEDLISAELEKLEKESSSSQCSPAPRFMIAGEAPVLMGKACELMIRELTTRAWYHTEKTKRKTIQKHDVHAAVADSDMYDFLIDIIPQKPAPHLPEISPPSYYDGMQSFMPPTFVDVRPRTHHVTQISRDVAAAPDQQRPVH